MIDNTLHPISEDFFLSIDKATCQFVADFLNPHPPSCTVNPIVVEARFDERIKQVQEKVLAQAIQSLGYRDFLGTEYWGVVSSKVRRRDKSICQQCGEDWLKRMIGHNLKMQVHHLSYDHHGYEHKHLEDLQTICPVCHALQHGKLAAALLAHDILSRPELFLRRI